MGRFIDLSGKKIVSWFVISRGPNNKHGQSQWLCKCICGTIKIISGSTLRRKQSTQCKQCAGNAPKTSFILRGNIFKNINEFEGAVIGTVLGDACISKQKASKTYSLQFGHSTKQFAYALYKKELFSSLTPIRQYSSLQHKKYEQIKCYSNAHTLYSTLRKEFYAEANGEKTRKIISTKTMNKLTVLGLALWYQDDGHLKFHNDFGSPILCTDNFSQAEHKLMAKCLLDNFGLEWTVIKHGEKYYRLRLRNQFKKKFFEMIAPFIHKSMAYKISLKGKQAVNGCVEIISSTCLYCKNAFTTPIWYGDHKYCSSKCYNKSRKGVLINSIELVCRYCRKTFIVPHCRKKRRTHCSRECYLSARSVTIRDNPNQIQ